MIFHRTLLSLLFIVFSWSLCKAQYPQNILAEPAEQVLHTNKARLSFDFYNLHFFQNNEYYAGLVSGYTLPGMQLVPHLVYRNDSNLQISAGLQYLQMYEQDAKPILRPFFRIEWRIRPKLEFIMGHLFSHMSHPLPEPLMGRDNEMLYEMENGLQTRFVHKNLRFESWLSWENYIWQESTESEALWGGLAADVRIGFASNFHLEIPMSISFYHTGGQINVSNAPNELHANEMLSGRLIWNSMDTDRFSIAGGIELHHYRNRNNNTELYAIPLSFSEGLATRIYAGAKVANFCLHAEYWNGNNFYSPKGDWVYNNVSPDGTVYVKSHQFYKIELAHWKKISRNLSFALSCGAFYYPASQKFDYQMSIYLVFNRRFKLAEFSESIL